MKKFDLLMEEFPIKEKLLIMRDHILFHIITPEEEGVIMTIHYDPEITDERIKEIYELIWDKVIAVKYRGSYTSVMIKVG